MSDARNRGGVGESAGGGAGGGGRFPSCRSLDMHIFMQCMQLCNACTHVCMSRNVMQCVAIYVCM